MINYESLRSLVTSALVWKQVPLRPVLQTWSLPVVLQGGNAPTRRWVLMGIEEPQLSLLILLPSRMRRMSSSTTHSITTCCLTEAQKLRSSWLRKDASKTVSQNTPFFLRWLAQVFCFPNGRLVDTPSPVKRDSFWLSPKLLLIMRFITRIGVLPSSLPLPLTTYLRFCLKGTLRVINGIRRQVRN